MTDFEKMDAWASLEKDDRMGFIRKVYGILSAQLCLTAVTCAIPMVFPSTVPFFSNTPLLITSVVMTIVIMISLVCFKKLAQTVPINYILLTVFTLFEALLIGCLTARMDPLIVVQATVITAALVLGLTAYAMTTKSDFTFLYAFACSISLAMFTMFIISLFTGFFMKQLYFILGIVLYSIFLIVDTQMISNNYGLSTEDYILGAILLYMDIVMIFLYILQFLGSSK